MFSIRAALAGASLLTIGIANNTAADADTAKALGAVKLSLAQAIKAAEEEGEGKAINAKFERDGPRYEVKVISADKLVRYTLGANTGQVMATDHEVIEKHFVTLTPDQVRGSKTTLAQGPRSPPTAKSNPAGPASDVRVPVARVVRA